MSSSLIFVVFVLNCYFFHTVLADTTRVAKIEVMTASCEDCGMSILGQLSVKVHICFTTFAQCMSVFSKLKLLCKKSRCVEMVLVSAAWQKI